MPATILFNKPTSTLPPLAFATPVPSPGLVHLRRRKRAANEPPPLLKKRRSSSPCASSTNMRGSFLPIDMNLPFLDCESVDEGGETTNPSSTSFIPLPNILLIPRTKQSRNGCFVTSLPPQEQDNRDRSNYETGTRNRVYSAPSEENDDVTKNAEATLSDSSHSASSSKNMLTRRPSMSLPRSLSLQFNRSFLSLASAATKNSSSEFCPLSSSTSSLIQFTSSSSLKDIHNHDSNHPRNPMTTTRGYLATAIDVAIGLSI